MSTLTTRAPPRLLSLQKLPNLATLLFLYYFALSFCDSFFSNSLHLHLLFSLTGHRVLSKHTHAIILHCDSEINIDISVTREQWCVCSKKPIVVSSKMISCSYTYLNTFLLAQMTILLHRSTNLSLSQRKSS